VAQNEAAEGTPPPHLVATLPVYCYGTLTLVPSPKAEIW